MRTIPQQIRITVLALLLMLSGCAQPTIDPFTPAQSHTAALYPQVRWLVHDTDTLPLDLPPPGRFEVPEAPIDPAVAHTWDAPVATWMQHTLRSIATDQLTAPQAARILMLMSVTLNDALQVAAEARSQGTPANDDAVLAEAARRVLTGLFPLRATLYNEAAAVAQWAGVWRGEADSTAVANGQVIGAAVAEQILHYATQDGAYSPNMLNIPPAYTAGTWEPTPPYFMPPQDPHWMHVKTMAIGAANELRVPPPPTWGSSEMNEQIHIFRAAQTDLSAEERALAAQWAAEAGSVTPPGMWMQIAMAQIEADQIAQREAAAILAVLGVALHDAAITCWESKYYYNVIRPVQVMQADEPNWLPPIHTPPHPAYPSGHAAFSGAAAGVLRTFFPNITTELEQQADDAARSRIFGGIHWPIDGSAGLAQGYAVAERVLQVAGK